MKVELTEAEILVITLYLQMAISHSENEEANIGYRKIIDKLRTKDMNNQA